VAAVHQFRNQEECALRSDLPLDSTVVPRFAEPATFMRAPWVRSLDELDVALAGVPFDLPLNRNGTREGPAQVRQMSRLIRRHNEIGGPSPFDQVRVGDIGDAPFNPVDPYGSISKIADFYAEIRDREIPVIAAGGDHAVAYPALKGLAREPLGLIHFDAHPDAYDEVYGSKYNHATMLRRATEEGLIDPKRSITIGIKGTRFDLEDRSFHAQAGITLLTSADVEEVGRAAVIQRIREVIGDRPAYLTFDMDVLDPVYAIGTGAPEPGGLSMRDAQVILRGLHGLNLVGADVSEISPLHDPLNHTAINAANLMFEMLCLVAPVKARALSKADSKQ
jgi:guanidinopropionase